MASATGPGGVAISRNVNRTRPGSMYCERRVLHAMAWKCAQWGQVAEAYSTRWRGAPAAPIVTSSLLRLAACATPGKAMRQMPAAANARRDIEGVAITCSLQIGSGAYGLCLGPSSHQGKGPGRKLTKADPVAAPVR